MYDLYLGNRDVLASPGSYFFLSNSAGQGDEWLKSLNKGVWIPFTGGNSQKRTKWFMCSLVLLGDPPNTEHLTFTSLTKTENSSLILGFIESEEFLFLLQGFLGNDWRRRYCMSVGMGCAWFLWWWSNVWHLSVNVVCMRWACFASLDAPVWWKSSRRLLILVKGRLLTGSAPSLFSYTDFRSH